MTRKKFEQLVAEGFARLPEQFRAKIKNVGFLVEDEPSAAVRKEVGLRDDETLLGFYRGIPRTARGSEYGMGPTVPDAIIIYRKPTEEEARFLLFSSPPYLRGSTESARGRGSEGWGKRNDAKEESEEFKSAVREVVADTVWHEVAHYFGLDEEEVAHRELTRKDC